MSWTETDDTELEESYDRLSAAQKELESQIRPINVIITNIVKIKSKQFTTYDSKREPIITKIIPKDKWGEDMTDEDRLQIKGECTAKTIELLGVPDE